MITKEYAMAYKEVIEILNYVPDEDVAKIPQEKIDFYRNHMDNEYDYKIDETKDFSEQTISETTEAILACIFRDYWATPYQRERILAKERYDLENLLEEEKREKYNPDNIFKKNNDSEDVNDTETTIGMQMVEYKEPLYKIFINKIFSFLHSKKKIKGERNEIIR